MRWFFVWVLYCGSLLVAPLASAQDGDAARSASARALFEEGVKSADAGKWSEAADRFERALSLRDSQVIRYNLAVALSELGRLLEASEFLRQVSRDTAVDAQVRADAQARLDSISARISKLTVSLQPPDSSVLAELDAKRLDAAMVGVAIPIDPGVHRVRSVRDGQVIDEQEVTLPEGGSESVTLATGRVATPAEAAATVATPTPPLEPASQDERNDGRRSKLLWWGVGAGAVAVAAIVVVGVLIAGSSNDASPKTYEGDFDPPSVPVMGGR